MGKATPWGMIRAEHTTGVQVIPTQKTKVQHG
ncbi:MAG: hypothetical protein A4E62_02758 [Syntrophorhabdus sp. PtaU1.Bin002]|nr:MAG: hypothetical protein A4E58_01082 [Syntrophorhabdus sp. PtaB.Bin006]OPY65063.1 MAG: hypothetical protein A4E62_02758 [Syntrophorhabdus sp. PtaU1.Bin002]